MTLALQMPSCGSNLHMRDSESCFKHLPCQGSAACGSFGTGAAQRLSRLGFQDAQSHGWGEVPLFRPDLRISKEGFLGSMKAWCIIDFLLQR